MPNAYVFEHKGKLWYLYGKIVSLRGGRKQQIYWFSRILKEGALPSVPAGHSVSVCRIPVLKKTK